MISGIFIDRPRLAIVISVVITLAGILALFSIPVAHYPRITPPEIRVRATYPGANAEVLANSVAAPLEAAVNGVEDMIYMSSTCSNNGQYRAKRVLRGGHRPGHRPGQRAEPGAAGPVLSCPARWWSRGWRCGPAPRTSWG